MVEYGCTTADISLSKVIKTVSISELNLLYNYNTASTDYTAYKCHGQKNKNK